MYARPLPPIGVLPGGSAGVLLLMAGLLCGLLPTAALGQDGFSHGTHDPLFPLCRGCHEVDGSGPLYPAPALCSECHDGEELGRVSWSPPADDAGYGHPSHADATGVALGCTDCHADDGSLGLGALPSSCDRCHAEHHGGATACRACHAPSPMGQHDLGVHQGCGGAGCHDAATADVLVFDRELCLVCHRGMADHKPGRSCGRCHAVGQP